MTRNMGWVFAVALSLLPGAAQAQAKPMKHTAPEVTEVGPAAAAETDVAWLRRRVEELEAQLATRNADCPAEPKTKMKGKMKSAMPPSPMGKQKMGGGMGSMPMEGGDM